MKKKLLAAGLACTMVMASLAGCSSPDSNSGSEPAESTADSTDSKADTAEDDDFLVGMSITNMDVYNTTYLEYIKKDLDDLGIKYIITDGENDISKQLADVESLITAGADVIVMNPLYQDSSGTCTTTINEAGIPLIVRDQTTYDGEYDMFVGNPSYETVEVLANYIIDTYLADDPDMELNICACVGFLSSAERWTPFQEIMEGSEYADRIHVLDEKEGEWTMEGATTIAEDWVQTYDDVNMFFAENDEMAIACVNVLKAAGKDPGDYIIVGFNGDEIAQEAIKAGEMTATMFFNQAVGSELIVQGIQLLKDGYEIPKDKKDIDMVGMGVIAVMDENTIDSLTGEVPEIDLKAIFEE